MKKLLFTFLIFSISCTGTQHIGVPGTVKTNTVIDGKLFATAYQQKAAEYRALCFQAFNIAHLRIDEISLMETTKPKAIITDIDETILDNSAYEAHQVLQGKDYENASWHEWTNRINADTVSGALSFFKYASSKGIEIFYVTNRSESDRAVTLKNLKKFDFPNADDAHLFLLTNKSSKEERRQNIAATHDVVMLMGDNLADFSSLFDKKNNEERIQNVKAVASEFGNRFIVLPNFVYGDWESVIYNYEALTQSQKDSAMKASLHTY